MIALGYGPGPGGTTCHWLYVGIKDTYKYDAPPMTERLTRAPAKFSPTQRTRSVPNFVIIEVPWRPPMPYLSGAESRKRLNTPVRALAEDLSLLSI